MSTSSIDSSVCSLSLQNNKRKVDTVSPTEDPVATEAWRRVSTQTDQPPNSTLFNSPCTEDLSPVQALVLDCKPLPANVYRQTQGPRDAEHKRVEQSSSLKPLPLVPVTSFRGDVPVVGATLLPALQTPAVNKEWPLSKRPRTEQEFALWWKTLSTLYHKKASPSKQLSWESIGFEEQDIASFGMNWLLSTLAPAEVCSLTLKSVLELHLRKSNKHLERKKPKYDLDPGDPLAFLDKEVHPTVQIFHEWPSDDRVDTFILDRLIKITYPSFSRRSRVLTEQTYLCQLFLRLISIEDKLSFVHINKESNAYCINLSAHWHGMVLLKHFFQFTMALFISYYGSVGLCGTRDSCWHHLREEDDKDGEYDDATKAVLRTIHELIPRKQMNLEDRLFVHKEMFLHNTDNLKDNSKLGTDFLFYSDDLFMAYVSTKSAVIKHKLARSLPFEHALLFMLERVRTLPGSFADLLSMISNFTGVNCGVIVSKYEFQVLTQQQRSLTVHFSYCPPTENE